MTEKATQPLSAAQVDRGPWREVPLTAAEPTPEGQAKRVGPLSAAARHPWLVVLPILLIAVPGMIWGIVRTPNYHVQAQLLVGDVSVPAQSVPGYVAASEQLAGTYAHLVNSSTVIDPVAAELKLSPEKVGQMLSASPIAQSSILVIDVYAKNSDLANELATKTIDTLVTQVGTSQQGTDQVASLLAQYNKASAAVETARIEVASLTKSVNQLAQTAPGSAALASLQSQLVQKQADLDTANLQANSLSQQYQKAVSDASASSSTLQVIQSAALVGSDRQSRIQLVLAAALLLGGVLGLAWASWVANRRS